MADDGALFIGYDHIAYATRDTDASVKLFEALGFTVKIYKQEIDKFNVFVTKLVSQDHHVAELVESRGGPSVVTELLGDKETAVYHVCFKTNDFQRAREKLKGTGAVTVTRPMRIPYPLTPEHERFWASHMYHPSLGLFEITGPDAVDEAALAEGT
ncbi:VOC family protein [Myxococcus stipitatus]|uniref:VOC family protein n=1 Tax=Myxococcus stipitatus TaxID=83455 RepID=UPI0030CB10A0